MPDVADVEVRSMYATRRHDVFFSYTWKNKTVADKLVRALSDRGLVVFQDEPGMRHFDDISAAIEVALRNSRTLVAFYTQDYPRSPYCQWELYNALTCAYYLDGDIRRIMTIVRDVPFEQVRPRQLTEMRLPDGAIASADEVADAVRQKLDTIDDRCLGDALVPPSQRQPEPLAAMNDFSRRIARSSVCVVPGARSRQVWHSGRPHCRL